MPGPPVPAKARLVCAGSVFLAAMLLYFRTLAPTVTLVDSGELIVAASCAGVPHPPGFPLWVVLANLAAHVPVGSAARASILLRRFVRPWRAAFLSWR